MKININTALLIAVLSSTTSYAENATQNGENQPIVAAEKAPVKFDIDYMDNGVRVVIPKALPQIKLAQGEMIINKGGTPDVVYKIKDGYVNAGFNAENNALWRSGQSFMQIHAYSGSMHDYLQLRDNYKNASFKNNVGGYIKNAVVIAGIAVLGKAVYGDSLSGVQSMVGETASDHRNQNIANAHLGFFDGMDQLMQVGDEYVKFYSVNTNGENKGIVAFVTDQTTIDDDIVIRGIMKAHNFSK